METVTITKEFAQALLNLLSEMPYKTSAPYIQQLQQASNDTKGQVSEKAE